MSGAGYVPRCWQSRWRDRLGWFLFRHVAHPLVAAVAWDHYRWGRDCVSVQWTTEGGSHAHYRHPAHSTEGDS